jgi:hypothetical protein
MIINNMLVDDTIVFKKILILFELISINYLKFND